MQRLTLRARLTLSAAALPVLALGLPGCSDGDSGSGGGAAPPVLGGGDSLNVFVARGAAAHRGEVELRDAASSLEATFQVGNNRGLAVDFHGDLFQAGDGPNGPGVRVFARASRRAARAAFDPEHVERELRGAHTGLVGPRGVHLAHHAGLVLVADAGASQVVVFGTTAGGDVPPLAQSPMPAPPHDLVLDEVADRLFVTLADGTVGVIDGYVAGGFSGELSRVITPVTTAGTPPGTTGAQRPTSLFGIAYEPARDQLVVSDVGDPASPSDGALYVLAEASRASGGVRPARVVRGPRTLLGDPTDLALDGDTVRVAEASHGRGGLLVFERIFSGTASDIAPDAALDADAPDSLVLASDPARAPYEASDLDLGSRPAVLRQVLTTRDDAANTAHEDIRRHDVATLASTSAFDTGFRVASLDLDRTGDVYATTREGQVLVLNRVATGRVGERVSPSRDRVIHTIGLVAPRGIEVVESRGVLLVAESVGLAGPAVLVYSTEAQAFGVGVPARLALEVPAPPWGLDYDERSDRLFVALTDGTVAVFDAVFDGPTPPALPDRVFALARATAPTVRASMDLRGLVYVASRDALIVADVGPSEGAGSARDGWIAVVEGASTATGLVTPIVELAGPATSLGDPVALAFDGADLYVAEAALGGGLLLRFDGLFALDTASSTDVAPTMSQPAADIAGVTLVSSDLAPLRGGSIH